MSEPSTFASTVPLPTISALAVRLPAVFVTVPVPPPDGAAHDGTPEAEAAMNRRLDARRERA